MKQLIMEVRIRKMRSSSREEVMKIKTYCVAEKNHVEYKIEKGYQEMALEKNP